MPNKNQVINQKYQKKGEDSNHKDFTRKQKKEKYVFTSFLTLTNINLLKNPNELLSLIDNLIVKNQNKGEEISRTIDEAAGVAEYQMMEKNLCLSIARHVESAFKKHHPILDINNPENNEFYRITVRFQ